MTTFRVPRSGRTFAVPAAVFDDPRVRAFLRYLETTGELDPAAARRFAETIVIAAYADIGDSFLRATRALWGDVVRLRYELRAKYEALRNHFDAQRGRPVAELPPELQPEAFRGLFNELADRFDELVAVTVESHVRAMPPSELTPDIEVALVPAAAPPAEPTLRPRWEPHPAERGLPPEELPRPPEEVLSGTGEDAEALALGLPRDEDIQLPPDVLLDPVETREYRASLREQMRAERLGYKERFEEDLELRARVRAAGARFAARHGLTEAGWAWWIERIQRYGPFEAQLQALSALDAIFTAHGYGLVLRRGGAKGKVYKPDAIVESERGGFALAEYKEPLGPQPESFYDSAAGRQKLFEDLFERALMSQELPGCVGWTYDTGAAWLDELILRIVTERLGTRARAADHGSEGQGELAVAVAKSSLDYRNVPSAVISDGILTVPLWAVTTIGLTETYQLPPIGSTSARAVVATHDDAMTLSGVLVGEERYRWKLLLETLAESSKRGSALAAMTNGQLSGLIVVTAMTIRTDMQIQTLGFTASAGKRDALDVSISMAYMPLPGALGKLLDVASIGVGALALEGVGRGFVALTDVLGS